MQLYAYPPSCARAWAPRNFEGGGAPGPLPWRELWAIRGRQGDCVLLDGSEVPQNSNHILGTTTNHAKSTLQRNGPKPKCANTAARTLRR